MQHLNKTSDSSSDSGRLVGAASLVVTGASGFVGRRLCHYLLLRGHSVRALVRRDDQELRAAGADVCVVDLIDQASVRASIAGASIVFHCAANASFGNGPNYERDNVQTTRSLIKATEATCPDLQRFVLISTIGAVDRAPGDDCGAPLTEGSETFPISDYGRSKLACERMVEDSALPYVVIRPTMVVGATMRPDSHFAVFARLALAKRKNFFARIAWPGRLSVVHVDDVVEALVHAAFSPEAARQTFFCAGDDVQLAEFLDDAAPGVKRLRIESLVRAMRPLAARAPFKLKALLLPALTASDEKLRRTGWKPRYSGAAALAEVVRREQARLDPSADPGGATVITGAASGLGKAMAELLAPMRKRIILVDRNLDGLEAIVDRHKNCCTAVVDLADENAIQNFLIRDLASEQVTELFACAGLGARGPVQSLSTAVQRTMFAVNVLARLTMGRHIAEQMVQRHFGRIVFISSSSAFQPLPFMAAYAASNSALLSLGEAWAAELRRSGVRLMTVCPGGMKTNFQKSAGVKEVEGEKLMSPEEVALAIFRGLQGSRATLIVSPRSLLMSLLARVLPRSLSTRLWMRLMETMR